MLNPTGHIVWSPPDCSSFRCPNRLTALQSAVHLVFMNREETAASFMKTAPPLRLDGKLTFNDRPVFVFSHFYVGRVILGVTNETQMKAERLY